MKTYEIENEIKRRMSILREKIDNNCKGVKFPESEKIRCIGAFDELEDLLYSIIKRTF